VGDPVKDATGAGIAVVGTVVVVVAGTVVAVVVGVAFWSARTGSERSATMARRSMHRRIFVMRVSL
jgi:hypothetical protein